MKSSDEIKKGLEHCINGTSCRGCPYCEECAIASDCNPMQKDLQGYVQQLEEFADKKIVELFEKVEQLQAERDAAVADIRLAYTSYVGACQTCMRVKDQYDCDSAVGCAHCTDEKCTCQSCDNDYCNWQWRGVQKEE